MSILEDILDGKGPIRQFLNLDLLKQQMAVGDEIYNRIVAFNPETGDVGAFFVSLADPWMDDEKKAYTEYYAMARRMEQAGMRYGNTPVGQLFAEASRKFMEMAKDERKHYGYLQDLSRRIRAAMI